MITEFSPYIEIERLIANLMLTGMKFDDIRLMCYHKFPSYKEFVEGVLNEKID